MVDSAHQESNHRKYRPEYRHCESGPVSNKVSTRAPPPTEAISFNIFELKKQPEILWYYHAAVGFPTKPTWIKAINNKQYASWPGLTSAGVQKYFPESEETLKGHARKFKSELSSTKKELEVQEQDQEHVLSS